MCLSGFNCDWEQETLFGQKFRLQLFFSFPSPVSVAVHRQYMGDWRAAFCWVCPCDLPSSLPLPPSLSQSSPAGFTFSKYHHSSPGRGAEGGGVGVLGGYGRGPVKGQCVCPSPLLFSSPQAAENIGLCHRQQPHSSLTTLTMELQIYSGEERPAPFYCSPAPSPLSLAPSYSAFFSVSPSFLDSPPSSLTPLPPLCHGPSRPFLPTGASFLLLCSTSPGPGVWAVLIAEKK